MAKERKSNNGWYRVECGYKKRIDGALVPARFHTTKDPESHKVNRAAIKARWLAIKASGQTFWNDADIEALAKAGIISIRQTPHTVARQILATQDATIDPLNDNEKNPYVDNDGRVKVEAAPAAIEYVARKVWSRLDVRSSFFNSILAEAIRDPLGTFERCHRLFGWSGQQTTQFLFGITNNVNAPNPIAFDASETIETEGATQTNIVINTPTPLASTPLAPITPPLKDEKVE